MLKHDAVWFITGCSKGFGRELALQALRAGYRVVVSARDTASLDDIARQFGTTSAAVQLDVTDAEAARAAVAQAHARFGAVDVLVNNAGHGYLGAIEEGDDAGVRAMIDTNVFGAVNMIKAVLPGMRERRSGHIVNIGSVGGLTTTPGVGYYHIAKFALEGLTETLAKEVGPLGIGVTVVEPGAFRTDFRGGSMKHAHTQIEDYAQTVGKVREALLAGHGRQRGDPARACAAIIAALRSDRPPLHLVLGADAVDLVRAKLAELQCDLDAWEHVSGNTDFAADGHV